MGVKGLVSGQNSVWRRVILTLKSSGLRFSLEKVVTIQSPIIYLLNWLRLISTNSLIYQVSVPVDHSDFPEKLLAAVVRYNSNHI